jgi:hypothetical protein
MPLAEPLTACTAESLVKVQRMRIVAGSWMVTPMCVCLCVCVCMCVCGGSPYHTYRETHPQHLVRSHTLAPSCKKRARGLSISRTLAGWLEISRNRREIAAGWRWASRGHPAGYLDISQRLRVMAIHLSAISCEGYLSHEHLARWIYIHVYRHSYIRMHVQDTCTHTYTHAYIPVSPAHAM